MIVIMIASTPSLNASNRPLPICPLLTLLNFRCHSNRASYYIVATLQHSCLRKCEVTALRQEGNVYRERCESGRPPSGGQCRSWCLASGGSHGLPDVGRPLSSIVSINIALLTEGGRCLLSYL